MGVKNVHNAFLKTTMGKMFYLEFKFTQYERKEREKGSYNVIRERYIL